MPRPAKKLDTAARAKVARFLRVLRTNKETMIKPSMDFIVDAINNRQLESNEDLAELEEHFDVIREMCKAIPQKDSEDKAEVILLQQLDEDLPSFKVEGAGTVSSSTSKKWSIKDPAKLLEHVQKTGDAECFTQTVRKSWCDDWYEKKGKLPPGCDFYEITNISFTKERQKVKK